MNDNRKRPAANEPMPAWIGDQWGPPVSVYTRARAIEDGMLIDVTRDAEAVGWKVPAVLTATVASLCCGHLPDPADPHGILWGIRARAVLRCAIEAARAEIRAGRGSRDRITFAAPSAESLLGGSRTELVRGIIAHVGPGDDPAPVLTVMMPEDD